MKKFILFTAVILSLLTAPRAFAQEAPQEQTQELTKIADNVYAYVGGQDESASHSFAANAGIVVGRDGVLVVDTLVSAKEAFRFLTDIRKVTDKPIKYVANTHTHLDHALGNSFFSDMGAIIISHAADREMMAKQGEATLQNADAYGLTPEDMVGTRIALPTLSFSDRMQIDLGDIAVDLIRFAPAHTSGSLVVSIPSRKVVFSGDILFTDFHPFLADGDFDGWQKCLDALLAMDVEAVIPGHGPLSTKKDLSEMKDYLEQFDRLAKEFAAEAPESGESGDAKAAAAKMIEALPKRSQGGWMVEYNLKARYF